MKYPNTLPALPLIGYLESLCPVCETEHLFNPVFERANNRMLYCSACLSFIKNVSHKTELKQIDRDTASDPPVSQLPAVLPAKAALSLREQLAWEFSIRAADNWNWSWLNGEGNDEYKAEIDDVMRLGFRMADRFIAVAVEETKEGRR